MELTLRHWDPERDEPRYSLRRMGEIAMSVQRATIAAAAMSQDRPGDQDGDRP